jgi:hypothetical protein
VRERSARGFPEAYAAGARRQIVLLEHLCLARAEVGGEEDIRTAVRLSLR